MNNSDLQLTATVNTYQLLLQRYANYFVKNKLVAALIFDDVMADYSKVIAQIPHTETRSFLKTRTLTKCKQWNDVKLKGKNL